MTNLPRSPLFTPTTRPRKGPGVAPPLPMGPGVPREMKKLPESNYRVTEPEPEPDPAVSIPHCHNELPRPLQRSPLQRSCLEERPRGQTILSILRPESQRGACPPAAGDPGGDAGTGRRAGAQQTPCGSVRAVVPPSLPTRRRAGRVHRLSGTPRGAAPTAPAGPRPRPRPGGRVITL